MEIQPLVRLADFQAGVPGRIILSIDDFSLFPGTRVGLTGPSGSGKTTLVRAIVDTYLHRRQGDDIELPNTVLSYAPQRGGLLPWYSLQRNIDAVTELSGAGNVLSPPEIAQLANLFDLSGAMQTAAVHLSGGETQRAALLLALIRKADLYILDEPLNGVDYDRKMQILADISAFEALVGRAFFIISHDPDVLATLCDEVVFLGGQPTHIIETVTVDRRVTRLPDSIRARLS